MSTLDKLMNISSRLDHLENLAEWVARESVQTDSGISQSGTLICVLCDEVRESIFELAKQLEEQHAPLPAIDDETIH